MFQSRLQQPFIKLVSSSSKQVKAKAKATPTIFSSSSVSAPPRRLCSSHSKPFPITTSTQSFSTTASSPSSSPSSQPPKMPAPGPELQQYLNASHDKVFAYNEKWAAQQVERDPEFFEKLQAGQTPTYLWIGCSDSRIPAEVITGLEPGEAFVHRNIANLVANTDLNVMSVINYAVRHLQVKHIVVCGHYGCGGVKAALTPKDLGLLNPWLRNIRDVYRLHEAELDAIADEEERTNRLVELNVVEQCRNVIKTAAIQQSYESKGFPIVHGWVFGFKDGRIRDLKIDHEAMLRSIQKIYNLKDSE